MPKAKAPRAGDIEFAEMYARFAEETTEDVLQSDEPKFPERQIAAIAAFVGVARRQLPKCESILRADDYLECAAEVISDCYENDEDRYRIVAAQALVQRARNVMWEVIRAPKPAAGGEHAKT